MSDEAEHGWFYRIRELEAINAQITRHRDELAGALVRIAKADLPPGERPDSSDWVPNFWEWAPRIAREALGMDESTRRSESGAPSSAVSGSEGGRG